VVVDLKVEEVLALDEAVPATVVALDVAEEDLTDVESEALRVFGATGPDAEELDEPAVVVLSDPEVDEPGALAVAELGDPDDDELGEPGEPVVAVFQ